LETLTEGRQPAIQCRGLSKSFGTLTAVRDLNLTVNEGELFGFLGANGAGKTTSIKMMTGLLRPSSGTAIIGGHDIQGEPLQAKSVIGYVPDNPFLYEKLTGQEFLHFMADLYRVPTSGRDKRIADLLRLFALDEKAGDLIQGYSRGMRQKIALAGALIHRPRVVFLDEPTVGLDPKGARLLKEVLRRLCDDGAAVFVSTHILEIAERMCDRFAIIHRGDVIAVGAMPELRALAAAGSGSLEDVFLELTGGDETAELIRYLV
jgi:ABC-type multidrug transport system, ATPase component